MENREDILDRYREAPVTNSEMGLFDYDIIPDLNSPKFQRERGYSEKNFQIKDTEKSRRRHHSHGHRHQPAVNKTSVPMTESEPNLRIPAGAGPSKRNEHISERIKRDPILLVYYFASVALGIFVFLLSLTVIRSYGQELDRLLSCDRARYNAIAYEERGLMYYLCKTLKTIRSPGIKFLDT